MRNEILNKNISDYNPDDKGFYYTINWKNYKIYFFTVLPLSSIWDINFYAYYIILDS